MKFGDPVISIAEGAKTVAVYLTTLPNTHLIVWKDRLREIRSSGVHPWICPVCRGSTVWWSLTDTPTCARCTPMPPEVMDRAWTEAQTFIEFLAEDKPPASRQPILAELDRAILSGDLNELLRLCIGQHAMWVKIHRARAALDKQERGKP